MSHSDRYEALMLEHLYGLLEADEARELQEYLATPDGADLRVRAEQWRDKLSEAAKVPFGSVQFVPPGNLPAPKPATSPASPNSPTSRVDRRPIPMRTVWTQWVVAASLLIVFAGLGLPAAYQYFGWQAQTREVNERRMVLDTRRSELRKLEADFQVRREAVRKEQADAAAAHEAAQKAYSDALVSARNQVEQKDLAVRLTGPDRIQPGAPNSWTIETLDRQGRAALPRKMEVVVRDDKNAELLRETYDHPIRPTSLQLPTSFWSKVTPGSDLFLEVVAYSDDNRASTLAERLPLARPVFVTHLVTDKPLYKQGEVVRFRSLTLDRATFLPPDHDLHLRFRLKNPDEAEIPLDDANGRVVHKSKPVVGPDQKPLRGIGVGEYELADDAPGGEYTLEVVEVARSGQEKVLATRRFIVAAYSVDLFEKKLEFDGKSYGPGDKVQARIEVLRSAGGLMKDPRADVVVSANDREIYSEKNVRLATANNPKGQQPAPAIGHVRFTLPADLMAERDERGKPPGVKVSATIRDGADTEVITRLVPLVEKDFVVEFFPEGGDLVEGVPGRVYFLARTPSGKPADLKGYITDGTQTVIEIATLTDAEHPGVNRGLGVFALTPKSGAKYFLKLKSPTGIVESTKDGFPLPEVKPDGVVLTALDNVTEKGGAIRVQVQVGKGPRTLHVGAYARGRLIGHERVEVQAGSPVEVKLQGDESLGGVTRVTVFEEPRNAAEQRVNLIPRAERLVYRKPGQQLELSVKPDKKQYSPADKVGLDLSAANEKGQPVPAILLVAVVNQSVIAMADNRTDRLLPTHFLLAGEVKNPADLEHADFLLTNHPRAAAALDLLLGTQGWRRFAEQQVPPRSPADRDQVERMLVAHGQRSSGPIDRYRLEEQRVGAEFQPKREQAALRLTEAQMAAAEFRETAVPMFQNSRMVAEAHIGMAESEHSEAAVKLFHYETRANRLRSWSLPAFMLGLFALSVAAVAYAVRRPTAERRRYFATAGASVALAALVVVAVVRTHGTPTAAAAFARHEEEVKAQQGGAFVKGSTATMVQQPNVTKSDITPVVGKEGRRPLKKKDIVDPPMNGADSELDERWKLKGPRPVKDSPKDIDDEPIAPPAPRRGPDRKDAALPPAAPSSVVREYAHVRDRSLGSSMVDPTETVYWHPVLVLPENGHIQVGFQLADGMGRYQVLVAGHTVDGRIGAAVRMIDVPPPPTIKP